MLHVDAVLEDLMKEAQASKEASNATKEKA